MGEKIKFLESTLQDFRRKEDKYETVRQEIEKSHFSLLQSKEETLEVRV